MSALAFHNFDLTAPGRAEHLVGIRVSSGFLATLGIMPVIGRDITAAEDVPHGPPVVLISDRLWRERFAADPHIAGRSVDLDGESFTVIGVLPAAFHFLADTDVITPLRPNMPAIYADRSVDAVAVLARLGPGLTMGHAGAEMNTIQQDLDRRYPDANRGIGVAVTSLKQQILGDVKGTVLLLFGAVSLVLLIACANLANLLLARSTARAREFGIRAALGASRGRMIRQLLTESIVLSLAGGALGIVLAGFGLHMLLAAMPETLPRAGNIGLHLPVLLFTVVASIAVGIIFGLVPALQSASPNVQGALQKASRGSTSGRNVIFSRLVVVQFALTLVLMTGAGLLLRSIRNLWHVNPGFDTRHVISFHVGLSPSFTRTPAGTRTAYEQLLARIRQVPGVEAADLTNIVPLSGSRQWRSFLDRHSATSLSPGSSSRALLLDGTRLSEDDGDSAAAGQVLHARRSGRLRQGGRHRQRARTYVLSRSESGGTDAYGRALGRGPHRRRGRAMCGIGDWTIPAPITRARFTSRFISCRIRW